MISIAELKQHLKITSTDEDLLLAELEEAAVQFVETQTGRYFGPARSVTEYLRAAGDSLFLHEAPIGEVTVQRRSSATATAEAVEATEFAVRGRRLVKPAGWGTSEYEVTYSVGYEEGAQPEDIRGAVRDLVALAYRGRDGIVSETTGGYSYRLADADSVSGLRDTLRAYRRKPFGVA